MLLSDIRIRSAEESDLTAVENLFSHARTTMKEQGIDQWQDGYPFLSDLCEDVQQNRAYVLVLPDGTVAGYFSYTSEREDVYENITDGSFRESGRYSSVHRVVVSHELRGNGMGKRMFEYAVKLARIDLSRSLRCDTHEDNRPMRALLTKCGFQLCGTVYYERKGLKEKRIAFDLLL